MPKPPAHLPIDRGGRLGPSIFEVNPARKPASDIIVAEFADWAFDRFGVRLAAADVRRLLGEDDDDNVIVVDGAEVMLGTPARLRPEPTFSLVTLPDGEELRVRAGR